MPANLTPWLWIKDSDGYVLAYAYTDQSAGPSAKGAVVDGTPASYANAVEHPDRTYRRPDQFGATYLTMDEAKARGLPEKPPWMSIFEEGLVRLPAAAGETISGRVTFEGGPAPRGTQVSLGFMAGPSFIASDRTETAADGSFSMPKPHDEKMTIVVLAEAPSLCSSYVPASDGPISLELHRVATLEGTVRRAGKVVAAQVRMARKDGPAPYRLASGRDDGTFRVSDLVPGNYEVEVQGYDAGHMTNGATTRDTIALRIGETATRDFTLSTGVRIDVIVDPRNPDNKTFASVGLVTGHMTPARYGDVRKLFRTPAYRGANSLSIDKAGCIKTHFLDVPAGPYTVVAAMNVGSFSAGDDAPVAFVHVTAESEPLTARLDV